MNAMRLIFLRGVLCCVMMSELYAIPMKKELPKDLYSYQLPDPDPIPEDAVEPESSVMEAESQSEVVEEVAPPENEVDLVEMKELEERLNILKKRRDSVEKLFNDPATLQSKKQPKDIDYGLESDVLGFPVDRYKIITADRYIPCITENSINSELPGRVIVVVERNVFAPKGRNIVIPKGSRMICGYEKTKAGQTWDEAGLRRMNIFRY